VKLGVLLEKARIQVQAAGRALEDTGARTRAIERKLRAVEQLPEAEAAEALTLPLDGTADAEEAPAENEGEPAARE
jgi:DNA recombination protein RmuC